MLGWKTLGWKVLGGKVLAAVAMAGVPASPPGGEAPPGAPDSRPWAVADTLPDSTSRADLDTIPRFELPGVVVTPRRATVSSGGASAIEISLESPGLAPALNLGEVLRDLPLIRIRTNSRGEEQPTLRGAGSRQVAVLLDGVPLTLGWDHRTDLSLVPLQGARSITLHRGQSSLLHGPNVLGGVVEISLGTPGTAPRESGQPPDPRGSPAAPPGGDGMRVQASGRWESPGAWRLDADAMRAWGGASRGGASREWTLRSGLGVRESPGDHLPSGARSDPGLADSLLVGSRGRRLNSDLRRIQGFVSVRSQGDDGRWGSFSMTGHATERGVPPEAHTDSPRLWRYPDQQEVLLTLSGGIGSGGIGAPRGSGRRGSLEGNLGVRVGSLELEDFDDVRFETAIDRQLEDDRLISLRLSGHRDLPGGVVLRGGMTAADVLHDEGPPGAVREEYRQRLWSLGSELDSPFPSGAGGLQGRLTLGVVVDGADTPLAGPWDPVPGLHRWGGRAGATALLGSSGERRIHLAVSHRARIPSLREVYSGALGRFLPNPDLRPEMQTGLETGLTVARGGSELQLVLFGQTTGGGIVRVSVPQPDARSLLQRVNRDRIEARGLELLGRAEAAAGEVEADLTLQRVRVRGDDPALPVRPEYEPRWQGSLSVSSSPARLLGALTGDPTANRSASPPWHALIRTSMQGVGTQYCLDPASGEQARLTASYTASARGEVPIQSNAATPGIGRRDMTLSVEVANLTNALSFDQCGLPRPGRTFQLGLRVR